MKKIILLFLLISKAAFAQESNDKIVYLDSLYKEVSEENKFYTKVIKDYYLEKSEYKNLLFYKSNKLKEEKTVSEKDGGYLIGEEIQYYENGNKSCSVLYENKTRHGKTYTWYENGKLKEEGEFIAENSLTNKNFKMINYWNEKGEKTVIDGNGFVNSKNEFLEEHGNYKNGYRDGKWNGKSLKNAFEYEEIYSDGKLISGISTEEDGTKNEYTVLEVRPQPKKGVQHFYDFIAKKFSYPIAAKRQKIKGKIVIQFVVDKDGKIVEPKIIKGLGHGLDEEAIRVLLSYDKWIPALQRGRNVRCSYLLPLTLSTE